MTRWADPLTHWVNVDYADFVRWRETEARPEWRGAMTVLPIDPDYPAFIEAALEAARVRGYGDGGTKA